MMLDYFFLLGLQKKIMKNRTFTMIKPDAVENGHIGAILEKINLYLDLILNRPVRSINI